MSSKSLDYAFHSSMSRIPTWLVGHEDAVVLSCLCHGPCIRLMSDFLKGYLRALEVPLGSNP